MATYDESVLDPTLSFLDACLSDPSVGDYLSDHLRLKVNGAKRVAMSLECAVAALEEADKGEWRPSKAGTIGGEGASEACDVQYAQHSLHHWRDFLLSGRDRDLLIVDSLFDSLSSCAAEWDDYARSTDDEELIGAARDLRVVCLEVLYLALRVRCGDGGKHSGGVSIAQPGAVSVVIAAINQLSH